MPEAAPFEQILDDVAHDLAHADAAATEGPASAYALGRTALPLGETAADAETSWNKAMAWIADLAEPPRPQPLPSAEPDAMRRELALDAAHSLAELQRIRREFMWANHPDRCPNVPGELANRRVAVANMLIDDAVRALSPGSH